VGTKRDNPAIVGQSPVKFDLVERKSSSLHGITLKQLEFKQSDGLILSDKPNSCSIIGFSRGRKLRAHTRGTSDVKMSFPNSMPINIVICQL
jgi:hypothetical protein